MNTIELSKAVAALLADAIGHPVPMTLIYSVDGAEEIMICANMNRAHTVDMLETALGTIKQEAESEPGFQIHDPST